MVGQDAATALYRGNKELNYWYINTAVNTEQLQATQPETLPNIQPKKLLRI